MRTSSHHQPEAQHPKSPAIYTPAGRLPHLSGSQRTWRASLFVPLVVERIIVRRSPSPNNGDRSLRRRVTQSPRRRGRVSGDEFQGRVAAKLTGDAGWIYSWNFDSPPALMFIPFSCHPIQLNLSLIHI